MGGLNQTEAHLSQPGHQEDPTVPPAPVPVENEVSGPPNPSLSQNRPNLDESGPTVSANFMDNLSPGM